MTQSQDVTLFYGTKGNSDAKKTRLDCHAYMELKDICFGDNCNKKCSRIQKFRLQNLHEMSVDVILLLNNCVYVKFVNAIFPLFVILSEKLANFLVISGEFAKIMGTVREREFII